MMWFNPVLYGRLCTKISKTLHRFYCEYDGPRNDDDSFVDVSVLIQLLSKKLFITVRHVLTLCISCVIGLGSWFCTPKYNYLPISYMSNLL